MVMDKLTIPMVGLKKKCKTLWNIVTITTPVLPMVVNSTNVLLIITILSLLKVAQLMVKFLVLVHSMLMNVKPHGLVMISL